MHYLTEAGVKFLNEARPHTRKERSGEFVELKHNAPGDWHSGRAHKAIKRAEKSVRRLTPKEHKNLQGRSWSQTPAQARRSGETTTVKVGGKFKKFKGVKNIQDYQDIRGGQERPMSRQDVIDIGHATTRGETPAAIMSKHSRTGTMLQHTGRGRYTASKLTGGPGAEVAELHPLDIYRARGSKARRLRRERRGGFTRPPKDEPLPAGFKVRGDEPSKQG